MQIINVIKNKFKTAKSRERNIFLSVFTGVFVKFFSLFSILITIPLTLNYLGPEEFGLWMLITGVVGMLTFSDLGLGMGLQNALSKCIGENDNENPVFFISTTYAAVSVVSILIMFLFLAVFSWGGEGVFLIKVSNSVANHKYVILMAIVLFLVNLPVGIIQKVLNGLQKMYVSNNVIAVGHLLSFFSIFMAVWFDVGLIGLVFLFFVSPMICFLTFSIFFFYKNPSYCPKLKFIKLDILPLIMNTGAWTVLAQLVYSIKINAPLLIVSSALGLGVLAEFSIAHKISTIVTVLVNIGLQALWPIYGEAYANRDLLWIKKTMRRSLIITFLVSSSAALFISLFSEFLTATWLGSNVKVSQSLISLLCVVSVLGNINICFAVFLNGTNNFKNQFLYSSFFVFCSIVSSLYFVELYGVLGVVWSMLLLCELAMIPFFYINVKQVMMKNV